jgi:glyoxylase-like metal-dependent hydrolase (beta-lactamase superfamily II)
MVIDDGRRRFEILFLGRAHTGGDLVVWLPKERIAASGDLVVEPVPLVGSTSYPLEYAATLERLLALQAKAIVPGHGRIQRDPGYVRKMVGLLTSIRSQTEAAFEAGITLDEFRRKIDLSRFEKEFAGDSQHRRFVFENYVTLPATAAAFRQLSGKGN